MAKNIKRKTIPFIKNKQKETATIESDEESASDQEVNVDGFKLF